MPYRSPTDPRADRRQHIPSAFLATLALALVVPIASAFDIRTEDEIVDSGSIVPVRTTGIAPEAEVVFDLLPLRWSLYFRQAFDRLPATRSGDDRWQVEFPRVRPGWYALIARTRPQGADSALPDLQLAADPAAGRGVAIVPVRHGALRLGVRVHTEYERCVYAAGEPMRVFVSARGRDAFRGKVELVLEPMGWEGVERTLGVDALDCPAGQTRALAFDISRATTARWAPGSYALTAAINGKRLDRYPIRVVAPDAPHAGARWHRALPHGDAPRGSMPMDPTGFEAERHWIDTELEATPGANLWIPLSGGDRHAGAAPSLVLPHADDPELPPPAAYARPSQAHARAQLLLARGVAFGLAYGGDAPAPGADARTGDGADPDAAARHMLQCAQAWAHLPHFTAAYADTCAQPDGAAPPQERTRDAHSVSRGAWDARPSAAQARTHLEAQYPALFTLDHRNRCVAAQSRADAWGDGHCLPEAPSAGVTGATVIALSECRPDDEPQPYLLSAWLHRAAMDAGVPIWRAAAARFDGSPSRFLRDAVYLAGAGATPFFELPETARQSSRGADQSAFGALDRLATVSRFLVVYGDFLRRTRALDEAAVYLPADDTDDAAASLVTLLPALLFCGYQVAVLTPADLESVAAGRWRLLFAPARSVPPTLQEAEAFRRMLAAGGRILSTPPDSASFDDDRRDLSALGIVSLSIEKRDPNGRPKLDPRTGAPEIERIWVSAADPTQPPGIEEWARVAQAQVWTAVPGVEVLPLDTAVRLAGRDSAGRPMTYAPRAHATGATDWANVTGAARELAAALAPTLAHRHPAAVWKSSPEVIVQARTLGEGANAPLVLFVSNFTIPSAAAWLTPRVPWRFWQSYAEPCTVTVGVRRASAAVAYDLVAGGEIPLHAAADDGVAAVLSLHDVEARVLVLLPERPVGAELHYPVDAPAGSTLGLRFQLRGAHGPIATPLPVRLSLRDGQERLLRDFHVTTQADGTLPPLTLPDTAALPLALEVSDRLSGFTARAVFAVPGGEPSGPRAAPPVTLVDAPAIRRTLLHAEALHVLHVNAPASDRNTDTEPPALDSERLHALAEALRAAGVQATTTPLEDAATAALLTPPWLGCPTMPALHEAAPALLAGHPDTNPALAHIAARRLLGRALDSGNLAPGHAVVGHLPRALSPQFDTIVLAAADAEGWDRAVRALLALLADEPPTDAFLADREAARWDWLLPAVRERKDRLGLHPPLSADILPPDRTANAVPAPPPAFERAFAPRVFALDASPGGVAVSLASQTVPVALLDPDGNVRATLGGGSNVWARDVAVSADGRTVVAGFALSGRIEASRDGASLWSDRSAVVHGTDALHADTRRDSERFLAPTPDRLFVVTAEGAAGLVCRRLADGATRWRIRVATAPGRPGGPPHGEIAIDPEGRFALVRPQVHSRETPNGAWSYARQTHLVELGTGHIAWSRADNVGGGDPHAVVGPGGRWTATMGRGVELTLRGATGAVLRQFGPPDLPPSLGRGGKTEPLLLLPTLRPDRLVLAKRETEALYRMSLRLGPTPGQEGSEPDCALLSEVAIALPARLHDAVVDPQGSAVYVGLWDGTVRAYTLEDGALRWTTPVEGPAVLALTEGALYAGGTRGDVYRLAPEDGAIAWRTHLGAPALLAGPATQ